MIGADIGKLQMELKRNAGDIRQLEAGKRAARIKITELEAQIKRLRDSDGAPKRIWRLENELAGLTRTRNALAAGLERARVRESAKLQSLKRIEKAGQEALKLHRFRKIRGK